MKGKLTIIRVNGTKETTHLDTKPSLKQLQGAVGGFIQLIPRFNELNGERCMAFCDEEGKLKGYGLNPSATRLWEDQGGFDILLGDVVVITGDDELFASM